MDVRFQLESIKHLNKLVRQRVCSKPYAFLYHLKSIGDEAGSDCDPLCPHILRHIKDNESLYAIRFWFVDFLMAEMAFAFGRNSPYVAPSGFTFLD